MELSGVDVYDPDNYAGGPPHEMFATLRREAPVYWHPLPGGDGFWSVTRHDDIVKVNRDPRTFSSWAGGALLDVADEESLEQSRLMMLNMDPPEHTRLRKIVNKGFTPRRIRALMDALEERARVIVAEVAPKGGCDLVEEVSAELPLQAIAELLGVPQEDRHKVFDWSNRMIGFDDPEFGTSPADAEVAAMELWAYAQDLAARKREQPGDDIVTVLLEAEVDGERLSDMDFNMFFLLLAVAGNETTRNAISHSILALIEHPDQRQKLLDDPSLIDPAIEEFLRWASPVMQFKRTATVDTEIAGQEIKAGDPVVIWHISGNRDESVFDRPYELDVERDPNLHLLQIAFGGGGPHFCLGANLARAEMKIMISEVLRVLPDMELAGPVDRLRSNFINGIKRMPVRYTPAR